MARRDTRIPRRMAKGQKELSEEDREYNYSIDAPRSVVENGFRRIKTCPLVRGIFRGSIAELGDTVVFLTGVVNLRRIMG